MQHTPKEIKVLKSKVKTMYVAEGKTAKEIAEIIHVTEKTVGKWIKAYGWKALKKINEGKKLGVMDIGQLGKELLLNGLADYINTNSPALHGQVKPIIDKYLQLITIN